MVKRYKIDMGDDIDISKVVDVIDTNKPILIVCIGTMNVVRDSIGPEVGSRLKELGFNVLGTKDEPVHGLNIISTADFIKENYEDHFIIGIDASIGVKKGLIILDNKPISPGKGVNKTLPDIGDVSIKGNVATLYEVGTNKNTKYRVLNTRDEVVPYLIDRIVDIFKQLKEVKAR